MALTTANVIDTKSGTGWTIDVTAANLLPDLSIKDFIMLIDSVLEPNANITKTSQTVLTYNGASISSSTVEVRRVTPNDRFQDITFAERFSSTVFNEEIDRIIRRGYEATLNGIGPGSTVTTVAPTNDAYPTGWSTDTVRSRTANRLFEEFEKRGTLSENEAVTGDWTATTQTDADASTKLATTAYADTRVANALSGSPALGGNPTAPTGTQGDADTSIANTRFATEMVNPYVEVTGLVVPVTTSSGFVPVKFDTEVSDLNSAFNLVTGVFTVPVNGAGVYHCQLCTIILNNDASTRSFVIAVDVNSTGAVVRHMDQQLIVSGGSQVLSGSVSIDLSDSDTIELAIFNPALTSYTYGSATTTNSLNWLTIQRIGAPLAIA